MSKNSTQLKSAIQNLNIKKPYDLRAQMRPKFQAPKDDQIEHTHKKPTHSEHIQNQYTQNEGAQLEIAQIDPAQIKAAHSEHAQAREPRNGFFMLAHSVFENEVTRKLSGDAFKVFIWMSSQAWRYQHSNGEFRGAVEYIAVVSGCSRSTVTRALRDLKSLKLIVCVEQNYKKGNLWRVSAIANGRGKDGESKDGQNEDAQIEQAQSEPVVCSKRAGRMLKLNTEHAQNEHHLISSNKINNNSQEVAESLIEIKMIWEKFSETFQTEEEQNSEIEKRLAGLPFSSKQKFARDMAVLKWWDGQIST